MDPTSTKIGVVTAQKIGLWNVKPVEGIAWGDGRGGILFTIRPNGSIELGEGVTLDEAAQKFWDAVASVAPGWAQRACPTCNV